MLQAKLSPTFTPEYFPTSLAGPSSSNPSGESSTTRARTVASVRRRGTTRGRGRGRGRGRRGRVRGRTRSTSRTRGGTRKRKRRTKRKTKTGTSTSTGKKVTKRRKYKRTRTTSEYYMKWILHKILVTHFFQFSLKPPEGYCFHSFEQGDY